MTTYTKESTSGTFSVTVNTIDGGFKLVFTGPNGQIMKTENLAAEQRATIAPLAEQWLSGVTVLNG